MEEGESFIPANGVVSTGFKVVDVSHELVLVGVSIAPKPPVIPIQSFESSREELLTFSLVHYAFDGYRYNRRLGCPWGVIVNLSG